MPEFWWPWFELGIAKGAADPAAGAARRFDGAADCTVVKVVVRDRKDGAGEVKVLPSPPPMPLVLTAPPAVAIVSGFEFAPSEVAVSGLVDTVGATDL